MPNWIELECTGAPDWPFRTVGGPWSASGWIAGKRAKRVESNKNLPVNQRALTGAELVASGGGLEGIVVGKASERLMMKGVFVYFIFKFSHSFNSIFEYIHVYI